MKKFVLALFLLVLLSGCRSESFSFNSSLVDLENDLEPILDRMMEKGNYNDNIRVDYDKVVLVLDYRNGDIVIENIQFSVFRKLDGELRLYDRTGCFNEVGELKCKEEKYQSAGERATEEVLLRDAFDLFTTIDVSGIVSEVRQEFNVPPTEYSILITHLVLPSDIEERTENYENIVFFYDNEYHYDENYIPDEMMLEVVLHLFGNGEGDSYVIYFELE